MLKMATDGALGGAVDNAFRTAYDGGSVDEILEAGAAYAATHVWRGTLDPKTVKNIRAVVNRMLEF